MGGKSRKSGGVSKALIERLKAGANNQAKKKCGTAPKKPDKTNLLDNDEGED